MGDALTDAINAPAGRLAEVLVKRMPRTESELEMTAEARLRFDSLALASGRFGRLARAIFAANLSLLFERMPNWTSLRIVPLFDWSSPEASDLWNARKYSNYIGSPELFGLLKTPFLELFTRQDVPEDDLDSFAEWLVSIALANQKRSAGYPISYIEMRSALRSAGSRSLASVGHRLAIEMESAKPSEKKHQWQSVVGPVFQAIWPLDAELQSESVTFKLVQILRASGEAFPEAADLIIPFVRPERYSTSIFSLSNADDILYTSSPSKMLDLTAAVVGDGAVRGVYYLNKVLDRIKQAAPTLADTRKFQRLELFAAP